MFVLSLYSRAGYLCRFPLSFAIVYARNGGYGTRKSVEYESTFLTSASDAGDSGLLRRNQLSMDRSREKTRWSARNSPVSDWKSREWCRWMHGSAPLSKVSTFYSREEKIKGKVEEEKVRIMAKISRSFSFQCSLWRTRRASSVSGAWKIAIFIVFWRRATRRETRKGRISSGICGELECKEGQRAEKQGRMCFLFIVCEAQIPSYKINEIFCNTDILTRKRRFPRPSFQTIGKSFPEETFEDFRDKTNRKATSQNVKCFKQDKRNIRRHREKKNSRKLSNLLSIGNRPLITLMES